VSKTISNSLLLGEQRENSLPVNVKITRIHDNHVGQDPKVHGKGRKIPANENKASKGETDAMKAKYITTSRNGMQMDTSRQ